MNPIGYPKNGKINLSEVDLYGWQGQVSKYLVDSFIRGIDAGDNIPPVKVYEINSKTYQLNQSSYDGKKKDGGHHRAVAFHQRARPLDIIILGKKEEVDFGWFMPVNIRDIVLATDAHAKERYEKAKKQDKKYR